MAFAVTCKSCQARFLLNDDLLRRKVAGKIVTVRCRQCHATIEVDAKDVDPKAVPATDKPEPEPPSPPPPGAGPLRAPRPAPAPPRPAAKSTLMGIGAPRAAGATELVALSPGFLDVKPAPAAATTAHGFPEPPPPPGTIEVLDAGDWDEIETPPIAPAAANDEPVPESLDDFAEELPPSLPPEEEMPSSTGTPSLKALTHHDAPLPKPPSDDFLANMSAAMNGGMMTGAPTIDVSGLTSAPTEPQAPSIDVSRLDAPVRGSKTLPLFSLEEPPEAAPQAPAMSEPRQAATASPNGSLSPSTVDSRSREDKPADSPRERRNVVAPATRSVPPPAPDDKKASGLAAPLLLALAAAAGFLIWKRSSAHAPQAEARPEPAAEHAPAPPPAPAPVPAAEPIAAAPAPAAPPAEEELTFETAPNKPAVPGGAKPASPAAEDAKPASATPAPATPAVVKEEAKPEPAIEPKPPAEAPSGPFDRAAASAALTASAAQASSCRKDGDPSGVASVVITFAPSGRVTSANISGPPFAGTPTGGCIASTLRKAKIPAFEGERVTVSKTVVIQ
jgi:predicted Zn finger-like uncharacterized protein